MRTVRLGVVLSDKASSTWHRIANIDSEARIGTCSQCGPGVPISPAGNGWRCTFKWNQGKREPHGMDREAAREYLRNKSCRICGTTENLVVDHCHDSLRVRGALCSNHNLALGLFADNLEHLRAAIGYLLETEGVDSPLVTL